MFFAAIAGGDALLVAASVVFADRTGLHCLTYGSKGLPTLADGPVAVGTDASVYAPGATITISATNRTSAPIYLFQGMVFRQVNCRGIEVERLEGGTWKGVDEVFCSHGDMAPADYTGAASRLAPGEVGGAQWSQQDLNNGDPDPLSVPGTYRAFLRYVPEATVLALRARGAGVPARELPLGLYPTATPSASPPFRVCICARCD